MQLNNFKIFTLTKLIQRPSGENSVLDICLGNINIVTGLKVCHFTLEDVQVNKLHVHILFQLLDKYLSYSLY